MRIGIFTLPLHTNYGGILQAYALQTVLERMGNEVVVFDKPFEESHIPYWRKPLTYGKRAFLKYILGKNIDIFSETTSFAKQCIERKYTQPFIDKYIHRRIIRSWQDIKSNEYDCIIVGSDQIWRMKVFKSLWLSNNSADAFLDFTRGWRLKRIAYAASFGKGTSDIQDSELDSCRQAIRQFDKVSVREESGVEICKSLFDIDALWVLDPTMLLSNIDYIHLLKTHDTEILSNRTLASYILDENDDISKLREKIAKEKKLKINISNIAEFGNSNRGIVPQPPLENWLKSIMEADYVINDSFHACVFSILFHKQFTVIGNKERGMERLVSLLKMFGLENRLISDTKDYKMLPDIDYSRVDEILRKKKEESFQFLKSSLK